MKANNSSIFNLIYLFNFFKFYNFIYLCNITLIFFINKPTLYIFLKKKTSIKSSYIIFFKYFFNVIKLNNLKLNLFANSSKTYFNLFSFFSTSKFKYNLLLLNNYLNILFNNEIKFLILAPSTMNSSKLIYYTLLYSYKDLISYRWFFNLEDNFIKQRKWQTFIYYLIKKYKINYLIILDEIYINKKLKILNIFKYIKILAINILTRIHQNDYKLVFNSKIYFYYIFVQYIYYISIILLLIKKHILFIHFFKKNFSLLSYKLK